MFINLNRFKTSRLAKAISSLFLDFTATNTLDNRVTFSRTSNATVTRSDGTIGYAPHNLLTFSEQFDNAAWSKSNATVTANSIAAPNSTTTADKLVETATTGVHSVYPANYSAQSTVITVSVYAKAAERTSLLLEIANFATGGALCRFNLSTGIAGAPSSNTGDYSNVSASITSVGNGWYRCSLTATKGTTNSNNYFVIYLDNGTTNSYAGVAGNGAHIWGAQLELGASPTAYNPTTVKNLLGFTQEFDNAAWTKSNSFVQTNLLTFSEEFDNASWTKGNSTVTANTTIAPDGATTADKLVENTATSTHQFFQSTTKVASAILSTCSVYVKASERTRVFVSLTDFGGNESNAIFNLANGTASSVTNVGTFTGGITTITSVGNDWYRCAISATTSTSTTIALLVRMVEGVSNIVYTGNGTSGLFVWGAQLVQGAVAGDYVRTSSTVMPVMYQAPTGTLSADKLVENSATSTHSINQSPTVTSGASYTLSCYAKAGERNFVQLLMLGGFAANITALFDLTTGAVGASGGSPITQAINVGNGWWRFSITATATSTTTTTVQIRPSSTSTTASYAGDGTSGIYIWGAQLSDSASLDPYVYNPVAAPTSTAYYGPRFDYDPVTLQPKGLLIEEQRTNLLLQSENLGTTWVNTESSETLNATVSPDGTADADKLVENTATNFHAIEQTVASVSAIAYTFSVYAKYSERNIQIFFGFNDVTGNPHANFNLQNGTLGTTAGTITASIQDVGNGWYRCNATITSAVTADFQCFVALTTSTSAARAASYTGNGTGGAFIWGAQLEAGAFATSYIPTVASQVTRAADTAVIQGSNFSSWYNPNEGTVYSQYSKGNITASGRVFTISNGTNNNQIRFSVVGRPDWQIVNNGSVEANVLGIDTSANAIVKIAGVYKNNDIQASVNGTLRTEDTTAIIPAVSIMHLGTNELLAGALNGHIQSFSYYNTRLSNATLQAITS